MYEGYDDGWYMYGEGYRNTTVKTETKSNYEKEPITMDAIKKNVVKAIMDTLDKDKNIIYMEPIVDIKMKQLMAIAGDKEIFGKLIVDEEKVGLVIKDILVPSQVVGGASFDHDRIDNGQFMYALTFKNNDPRKVDGKATGEKRSMEELSYLTKHLSGHFHSHNSVSSTSVPHNSGVDTSDMVDQVEGRDYWIEVIGSNAGYSGRMLVEKPTRVWGDLEIKIKWWTGIEDMMNQVNGKINTTKWVSSYETKNDNGLLDWTYYKCEKCGVERYGKYMWKVDGKNYCFSCKDDIQKSNKENKTIKKKTYLPKEVRGKTIPLGENGIKESEENDIDDVSFETFIQKEWDEKDPLLIDTSIVPQDKQEEFIEHLSKLLKEGEKLVWSIFQDNTIELNIVGEQVYDYEDAFTRLWIEDEKFATKWDDYCANELGIAEDLSTWLMNGKDVPRHASYPTKNDIEEAEKKSVKNSFDDNICVECNEEVKGTRQFINGLIYCEECGDKVWKALGN
jgi:hypothetical protein